MRKDNKFRRETAKKIIELLCEGVPCYEAYEQTSEKGSVRGGTNRVHVSRSAQEFPQFEAALELAKFAGKIKPLAEEINAAELRDIYGYAKQTALNLIGDWSDGR